MANMKYKKNKRLKTQIVHFPGQGDLIGSDLEYHLNNPNHEITLKSSSDVKALTYCEMKVNWHLPGIHIFRRRRRFGDLKAFSITSS